jgi:inner membrane protein
MQGKVHVAIGVASTFFLVCKYPTGLELFGTTVLPEIALLTAAAGSYAPDVDLGRTHEGQKHKITNKVVSKVGGGHRGITHTLLVPAIVAVIMFLISYFLSPYKYIAMVLMSLVFGYEVGYCMHIFADLFNGKGVPLFWPIMKGKVHIMDLPSSGVIPWIFTAVFVAIMAAIIYGGLLG